MSSRVRDFLSASVGHQDQGQRRRRWAAFTLSVVTLVAFTCAVSAFQQRATARAERDSAISGEVTAEADALRGTDRSLAARLDLAAYRIHPTSTLVTDLLGTQSAPLSTPLAGHTGKVYAVAYSPVGHLLATAGSEDTIRLWDVADATHPSPLGAGFAAHSGGVMSLALRPDGRTPASTGRDHTIGLWNVSRPCRPVAWTPPLHGHTGIVFSVSFSPDGRSLTSAGDDDTVRLWSVADPAHPARLGEPLHSRKGAVAPAVHSPDGRTVASAGHDHTIRLWNVTHPGRQVVWGPAMTGHSDTVHAVAFSPDSRIMASVSNDRGLRLWNVANPADPVGLGVVPQAAANTIYAVAFSPDGRVVATAGADQTIRLWDVTDPARPTAVGGAVTGHTGPRPGAVQSGRALFCQHRRRPHRRPAVHESRRRHPPDLRRDERHHHRPGVEPLRPVAPLPQALRLTSPPSRCQPAPVVTAELHLAEADATCQQQSAVAETIVQVRRDAEKTLYAAAPRMWTPCDSSARGLWPGRTRRRRSHRGPRTIAPEPRCPQGRAVAHGGCSAWAGTLNTIREPSQLFSIATPRT